MRATRGFALAAGLLGGCIPAIERAPQPTSPAAVPVRATAPVARRTPLVLDLGEMRDDPVVRPRADVARDAVDVAGGEHVVRSGETLRSIGEATGVGGDALVRANGLTLPYRMSAGQRLVVPGGRYHRVREGQTGIAIALAYGVRWSAVVAANALAEPYQLRAGQRLALPVAAPPPPATAATPSLERRAAAFQIGIDDIVTGSTPATRAPVPERLAVRSAGIGPSRLFWPADGRVVARFGRLSGASVNQGIDMAVTGGATVRAAGAGTVAYVGNGVPGYGGLILVRHGGNLITAYGRVATATVRRNDTVSAGQAIATADGTAPLHFEVRRARIPVDPLSYLPPR